MLKSFLRVTGIAFALGFGVSATAGAYPEQPVTVIVPFAAGGGGDTLARMATNAIAKELNQSMVVENRPGAGGNIGTAQMTRSKPDGYTLAYGTNGTAAINHWLYKNPGFSIDDLEPVSRLTTIAAALVVRPDMGVKSVKELIAFGNENPNKLTCGSAGNGTTSHIACELFKQMTGLEIQHVPYKGGAAAMTDLIGGRISMLIDVMPNLTTQIASGNLLPLAVTTNERIESYPDIPTMSEAGVPDYYFFAWDGIYAPKGTPVDVLNQLNAAVKAGMQRPEVVEAFKSRGAEPATTSREELLAFVKDEHKRLGEVVKKAGARID
ncbi:MAG: tripartite tricarboxylate transporter substrate binding protein [Advenella sp.]